MRRICGLLFVEGMLKWPLERLSDRLTGYTCNIIESFDKLFHIKGGVDMVCLIGIAAAGAGLTELIIKWLFG